MNLHNFIKLGHCFFLCNTTMPNSMTQYQAGYILDSVSSSLTPENALLSWLSTFDVDTTIDLQKDKLVPSVLAVAANIVTRGRPTLADVFIEKYYEQHLGLTQQTIYPNGKIGHPFIYEIDKQDFIRAFHIVEPRAVNRREYLRLSDLESNFEKRFLLDLIPTQKNVLPQLLQKQRSKGSLQLDNDKGRVDMSLEIPGNKTYIIEVDGAQYHHTLKDNMRDYELHQHGHKHIYRIRQGKEQEGANFFLNDLFMESFIQHTAANYHIGYLQSSELSLAVSPFGVARIQYMLLLYLMKYHEQTEVKLAIIERDIPCAYAAVKCLEQLLDILQELSQSQVHLPKIYLSVFASDEFLSHPLHGRQVVKSISACEVDAYDLVLDISVLRRTGVFREDSPARNTMIIRSAHFIQQDTVAPIHVAAALNYRSMGSFSPDEVFEPNHESVTLLRKILQSIFRKNDFREGQLAILNRALQNHSVIGLLPTGGGKSLTYQLAALLQPGITVIVDPIRSLMVDQHNGLRELYIDKSAYINSTLDIATRTLHQKHISQGLLQFIFVSPERFVIDEFRTVLDAAYKAGYCFSYAVIDEVHCVSEWGHDFRTPYLSLGVNMQQYCPTFNGRPVPLLGLTATASFDVLADIERELLIPEDDGNAVVRFENTVRNEINYVIVDVPCHEKDLRDEFAVRKAVGKLKQAAVTQLLAEKETVFQPFNDPALLHHTLTYARQQYAVGRDIDAEKYINGQLNKLLIKAPVFKGTEKYNYGVIVFMPHRQGWLGIKSTQSAIGLFDHLNQTLKDEHFGFFMGSGSDDDGGLIDEQSFRNLEAFKQNEISVMVATKAFGMGIDKPDVRMTIHTNIPSSIESFVQEAGRAGRDGHTAVSVILYNDYLKTFAGRKEPYHLDKDVLLYFHNTSFKGQLKERVMVYELRNRITYPNITNRELLIENINLQFGNTDLQFTIPQITDKNPNRLFINGVPFCSVGYVDLLTGETGTYKGLANEAQCYEMVTWLKEQLPLAQFSSPDLIKSWLREIVMNNNQHDGIELLLKRMKEEEESTLIVPFTNRYYSKHVNDPAAFTLNPLFYHKLTSCKLMQRLLKERHYEENILKALFRDAIYDGLDYPEMIEKLSLPDGELKSALMDVSSPDAMEFQRTYYMPRGQDDTAKAIYRLISIGVIESYTIDYQHKLYELVIKKKPEEAYYGHLRDLMARYTSGNFATRELNLLRAKVDPDIKAGKMTVIGACLDYLTGFIYEKIKAKRLQSIEDMVGLCRDTISMQDRIAQNNYIKDEIYYYFNAKYSRRNFKENGKPASLLDDRESDLSPIAIVQKYITLVEDATTGVFINNVKHLRGACMKMLRSYPEVPEYKILKAFSLFILSAAVPGLGEQGLEELVGGLQMLHEREELNVQDFLQYFHDVLTQHIAADEVRFFIDEIEDRYYTVHYLNYLKQLNQQLLTE
jgi:ATP-dependent DNA helicase RecQ